jgi:hypothetical protein
VLRNNFLIVTIKNLFKKLTLEIKNRTFSLVVSLNSLLKIIAQHNLLFFQDVKEVAFSEIIAQHNLEKATSLTCHPHLHHPSRHHR